LPLAKALAEANSASLRIESNRGAGTLIEVTFPRERTVE
jgi:signal transduction histidine kinase